LTESVLFHLINNALMTFLGNAESFEASGRPGLQTVLSNEPVADLNMLCVARGADGDAFRTMAAPCLARQLPFLVIIFPEAKAEMAKVAEELGLVWAVDWPIMVRDDLAIEPSGNADVEVRRASCEADVEANADVLASAFHMPKDSVMRTVPMSFFDTPGADVFIARLNGSPVGSVTLTYHGETCGIWAMGTNTDRQHGGIGRRLLSSAIAQARDAGMKRFFLGATPAGKRLYDSLGFATVFSGSAWVSGVTHQA
jgi:GNAT superfamily N-acetyltransferase